MNSRKELPLEAFTIRVEPPSSRVAITCVNVHEDGKFNMNGKLAAILGGKHLKVLFEPKFQQFILQEDEESGIAFPKSGAIRLPELPQKLEAQNILLPVQYAVWFSQDRNVWYGEIQPNPTVKPSAKARCSKKQ